MEDLAESGMEPTVVEAVETLTRRPDEDHGEFVARICATPGVVGLIAQRVKLADLSVNLASAESSEERQRLEQHSSRKPRARARASLAHAATGAHVPAQTRSQENSRVSDDLDDRQRPGSRRCSTRQRGRFEDPQLEQTPLDG